MIPSLQFVARGLASKPFVPALAHLLMTNGRITSFNGETAFSSPIEIELDAFPHGDSFVKAIESCSSAFTIALTDSNRLLVKCGPFKTHVPCGDANEFPLLNIKGRKHKLGFPLVPSLKTLEPFIAQDASRPWARGILFRGQSLVATTNVILVESWTGGDIGFELNLPAEAVRHLVEIGEEPEHLCLSDNRVVFHFSGDRWMSSQLYSTEWPDIQPILDKYDQSGQKPVPPGFWEALEVLLDFTDESRKLFLFEDRLATGPDPKVEGTSVEVLGCPAAGCYNARYLYGLRKVINTIAFEDYPEPVSFFGDTLRGVIAGIRT